jgi:glucose/arabinose dehydrogenase
LGVFAIALALAALPPAPARAVIAFSQPGFVEDVVAGGLPFATAIAFAPDGRIFVALKSGVVRVVENGALLPGSFVDLSGQVNDHHDRGLLGIAVHPDFPSSPYVYLLFTHDPPGTTNDGGGGRVSRLVRVTADAAQGHDRAVAGSELPQTTPGGPGHWVMLGTNSTAANIGDASNGRDTTKASCMTAKSMAQPPIEDCIPADENSHTIGTVTFAADGSLFVGSGDGSNYTSVDPRALRAQRLDSLAGKILRIDPDTALGLPDNPFYDAASPGRNRSKVWSYGLRNPFRFGVHPVTSEPAIGDVGWDTWEEIDVGKGANFGWPCYEGGANSGNESGVTRSLRHSGYETQSSTSAACGALYAQGLAAVKAPWFAYKHGVADGSGASGGAAVGAGAYYGGATYPAAFQGALFMIDYSRRWIRTLKADGSGVAQVSNLGSETANGLVQVVSGPDTNLYVVVYDDAGSQVRRIRYVSGNTPPTAVASAAPLVGTAPLHVQFSSLGSYDPDAQSLAFAWDFGDGASASGPSASHAYLAAGAYTAVLTVSETTAPFASRQASVLITVGNEPPLATIDAPADGSAYQIGDTIDYAGSATSGGIPVDPAQLSWVLRVHHNQHVHFDPLGTGAGGQLVVEEHGDDTFLELCLTATVPPDLTDVRCVSLQPRKTTITLDSEPPGLAIAYLDEGVSLTTPAIVRSIVGSTQEIAVAPVQQGLSFDAWTDGEPSSTRAFVVGDTPFGFTARYENRPPSPVGQANVGAGPTRLTVDFDASASSDPEGTGLVFAWDFGDEAVGGGAATSHTYTAPGRYDAVLEVIDALGGAASAPVPVTIPNSAPIPVLGAAPGSGPAPLLVNADAAGSSDPDGDAIEYAWSFGDGAVASGPAASHAYAASGSYTLALTATDVFGASSTASVPILIGPPPPDGDGDGVPDAADLCPGVADPLQADSGGVGAGSAADGIGDACQCGDVTGDGVVTLQDALAVSRSLLSPPTATLARPERCDASADGRCTLLDAVVIRRALLDPPAATVQPRCGASSP